MQCFETDLLPRMVRGVRHGTPLTEPEETSSEAHGNTLKPAGDCSLPKRAPGRTYSCGVPFHVRTYVSAYVRVYVCIHVCIYVCVCMYVCTYVFYL